MRPARTSWMAGLDRVAVIVTAAPVWSRPVGLIPLGPELTIQLGLRNATISHHEDWKHLQETVSTLCLRYMEFCLGFEPRIS